MATPIANITELTLNQANKYLTHNEALRQIEAYSLGSFGGFESTPVVSPVLGARFIVKSPATGVWVGLENKIVQYNGSGWTIYNPFVDLVMRHSSNQRDYRYDGVKWQGSTSNKVNTFATPAIANNASYDFEPILPRITEIHRVTVSVPCRVRIYPLALSRTNDSDGVTINASQIGIIDFDFVSGSLVKNFVSGHRAINLDSPRADLLYFRVFNRSGATSSVSVTVDYYPVEYA